MRDNNFDNALSDSQYLTWTRERDATNPAIDERPGFLPAHTGFPLDLPVKRNPVKQNSL